MALEPEEGKAKFYLEVLLLHRNDCELFLTENWESLVMAGEFLFLVAFNIPLQMEKISIRKEFRERTTIQEVTEKFTVRSNYS